MSLPAKTVVYSSLAFSTLAIVILVVAAVSGRTPSGQAATYGGAQILIPPGSSQQPPISAGPPRNQLPIQSQPPTTQTPSSINTPLPVNVPISAAPPPTLPNNTVNTPAPANNTPPPANLPVTPPPTPTPVPPTVPLSSPSSPLAKVLASRPARTLQQVTNQVIAPALAFLSALNLLLATTITQWYPFLLRIFLEPAQILFRKRRRAWGVVYNALSKRPLDLAIVRLLQEDGLRGQTQHVFATRVTDRLGRYQFLVPPGRYRLAVAKPGFTFPSRLLGGTRRDDVFTALNYGEPLSLATRGLIQSNLPLDPPQTVPSPALILRRASKHTAHAVIAYLGLILGIIAVVVAHTWLAYSLMLLHILVFALFWRLARGRKPEPWGTVFDRATQAPLPRAVVRIHDAHYNRILEQQVSDGAGRFGFLVGRSTYYLDAIKPGYQFPATTKTKSRDYLGGMLQVRDEESSVAVDVPMEQLAPGQQPAPRPALNPAAPTGPIAPASSGI
ncbi:MAG: carboxypeptidase-like regulatory domain-containing protein [Candidatus Andersenbacteria bacterium]